MKNRNKLLSVALSSMCALTSCQAEFPNAGDVITSIPPIEYSGTTRGIAGGAYTFTAGDAFTFMSYPVGAVKLSNDFYQSGTYVYVPDANNGYVTFVPTWVTDFRWRPVANMATPVNPDYACAQHLAPGKYYTTVIHPCVATEFQQVRAMNALGFKAALLTRTYAGNKLIKDNPVNDIYVSKGPDFPITITAADTGAKYELPANLNMYLLQSKVEVYFYSSVGKSFSFKSTPLLLNAGGGGFYNPCTEEVYIDYRYTEIAWNDYISYAKYAANPNSYINQFNRNGTYEVPMTRTPDTGTGVGLTLPAATEMGGISLPANVPFYYTTGEFGCWPADYTGQSAAAIPMTLQVELLFDNGITQKQGIPISLNMKMCKKYIFYVDVSTTSMTLYYMVNDWDAYADGSDPNLGNDDDGNGEIGGDNGVLHYIGTLHYNGDWEPVGGGSQEIGN
ncbi:MAG: hypothetical protein LBL97_01925 [Prevotellaceae bacterium]|jgi:hypothetical protein|nr:hypothetical protein [Prevotellaceae bacterium]